MQQFNVASVIIAANTNDNHFWQEKTNGKYLLEHALQRHTLAANTTYILVPDADVKAQIITELANSEQIKNIEFIIQHTDLPSFNGEMRSMISICRELKKKHDLLLIDEVKYHQINSLDLLRLYQQLQDNPMEIVTYLRSDGRITATLLGLNLELTSRKLEDTINLGDNRISAFFRTSLNTGIIPITSATHHFTEWPNQVVEDDTQFDTPYIIRPGKSYLAARRMEQLDNMNPDSIRNMYLKELQTWQSVPMINEDVNHDTTTL